MGIEISSEKPGLTRLVHALSPNSVIEGSAVRRQDAVMRVNLTTRRSDSCDSSVGAIPISLTIRPACGLPGDYEFPTDSAALLRMLRRQTDLSDYVLQSFEAGLRTPSGAKLLGVELNESILTEIGYFID